MRIDDFVDDRRIIDEICTLFELRRSANRFIFNVCSSGVILELFIVFYIYSERSKPKLIVHQLLQLTARLPFRFFDRHRASGSNSVTISAPVDLRIDQKPAV